MTNYLYVCRYCTVFNSRSKVEFVMSEALSMWSIYGLAMSEEDTCIFLVSLFSLHILSVYSACNAIFSVHIYVSLNITKNRKRTFFGMITQMFAVISRWDGWFSNNDKLLLNSKFWLLQIVYILNRW